MTPRLYAAAATRAFATGIVGVLFGLYLAARGASPATLGLVVALGLAANALGTAVVAFAGERMGRRRALILLTGLSAAGLAGVAIAPSTLLVALAAFLGMVNGMGRDRGPAQTLDHSLLADHVSDAARTATFARYALLQDVAGALGALAAAAPAVLTDVAGWPEVRAHQLVLGAAAALSAVPIGLYASLPRDPAARPEDRARPWFAVSLGPESRRRVRTLAGLFALDSLGGGFLAGSIVTYWFFRQFGLDSGTLGPVFFAARILNAVSYLAAARMARRVGLLRTMVYTHLPSSVFLLLLPWVPSAGIAIALFLVREALVEMDVPTRQSYLAAVTAPGERTFALGVTAIVRNVGWAFGPALAGVAMASFGLGAPLVLGAGLKIVYDLALYRSFRNVRAPEERSRGPDRDARDPP